MFAQVALVIACLELAGCAALRPPAAPPELPRAHAAIREAEREGARADRRAAMHLALARSELAQAMRRLSIGDREGARWLLRRAEVDAELAALLVREAGLRDAAERTLDQANTLAEQLAEQAE
ncbi:hypothetical protein SOCE26_015330 [Sorangium cellulosum]|uniref:DUF4398 domain-containing protein n=1 Tax=Sorangium cellulosum TaxID=56 RepID=A0A2L0ELG1_SORCE|nr:DUF4398 domain-containing protein [Sorangium cellulosum]AUX40136.1 hypothetical protein SOCE26_015330 [Sorangium cellulosum]